MIDIVEGVCRVIAGTFRCDQALITRATQADDIEGWDSLSHTVLILAIERHFSVRLDPAVVLDVADVGGLIDHIEARCGIKTGIKTMAGA
jgi:acyl carrier protein